MAKLHEGERPDDLPGLVFPRRSWVKRLAEHVDVAKAVYAVAAGSIALHVWLRGIPTTQNIDVVVKKSVDTAMLDVKARLTDIETNTRGMPEWKEKLNVRITQDEVDIGRLDGRVSSLPLIIQRYNTVPRPQ
jgi:hypothetical protein